MLDSIAPRTEHQQKHTSKPNIHHSTINKWQQREQAFMLQLAACATGGRIADIIRIYVNKLYFVFIRDLFD